ncbi:MAG TPA: ester cyclase [Pyrinomonadaceae bacterium]
MTEEENKRVVLEYVEAFNRADMEALRGLFTTDALIYGVLGWGGMDKVVPIWRELHEAFAVRLQVEALIAEDEQVAVRYTERGTSVGPFRGQPATGKSYEIVAMEWFIIKEGKIHRRWGARDSAAQSRQMGLPIG